MTKPLSNFKINDKHDKAMKKINIVVIQLLLLCIFSFNAHAQWVATDSLDSPVRNICASGAYLYACSEATGVYRSSDFGFSFVAINNGLGNLSTRKMIARDSLLVLATSNSIYKSTNHGNSWSLATNGFPPPANLYDITGIIFRGDSILVATSGAGLYCSLDFCQSWFSLNNGLVNTNKKCLFDNGNRLFVGSLNEFNLNGGIHASDDNGGTWFPENNGVPHAFPTYYAEIYDFAKIELSLFASTFGYGILKTEDNGETWQNLGTSCLYGDNLLAINNTLFCSQLGPGISKSPDRGNSWSFINEGLVTTDDKSIYELYKVGSFIYAGSNSHKVFRRPVSEVVTGIQNISSKTYATVQPNPITDYSRIIIQDLGIEKYSIEVFNESGKCVKKFDGLEGKKLGLLKVEFVHGVYFFRITGTKNGLFYGKFIVD